MSNNPKGFQIDVNINAPEDNNKPSPTFGGAPNPQKVAEGMEKVGKHGKSHHSYLKVASQYKPPKEMKKISFEELAQHSKAEDAWLALNGVVYDVSVYLHYHPGGDIILSGAGKDATNLFCK